MLVKVLKTLLVLRRAIGESADAKFKVDRRDDDVDDITSEWRISKRKERGAKLADLLFSSARVHISLCCAES
jgi:hypothetical protein